MTTKTLTEIYQESQRQLEEIQHWKAGMFDRVREESLRKVSMIREGYMIDETEAQFRGIAKRLIIIEHVTLTPVEQLDTIHSIEDHLMVDEYIFTPKGMTVVYRTSFLTDNNITVEYTYQELQERLDHEKRIQDMLGEFRSTEELGSAERLQSSEHS